MSDINFYTAPDYSSYGTAYPSLLLQQQQTASNIALQQQQTQAAAMQNQITGAALPSVLQALQGQADQSALMPGSVQQGGSGPTPQEEDEMVGIPQAAGTAPAAVAAQPGAPANVPLSPSASGGGPPVAAGATNSATAMKGPPDPGDPGTPGSTPVNPGNFFNPAKADAAVQSRYFGAIQGLPTPQEQQQLMRAKLLQGSGNPTAAALGARLEQQVQYGIQQRKIGAQTDALNNYQAMVATTNADPNDALDVLANSGPVGAQAAAAIKRKFPNDPAAQNQAAVTWASHMAGVYHPFTGHGVKTLEDGRVVDDQTFQPIPGVGSVGLTPDQDRLAHQYWNAPYEKGVPDALGNITHPPMWQASGMLGGPKYKNADDAVKQNRANGGIAPQILSQSKVPPQVAQTKQKVAAAVNARAQQQQQAVGAVQQAQAKAQAIRQVSADQATQSAYDQQAFSDPQYKLANAKDIQAAPGTEAGPIVQAARKNVGDEMAGLYKDSQQAVNTDQAVLTYVDAAQKIMASPGRPPVGLGAGLQAEFQNFIHTAKIDLGGKAGDPNSYVARYQDAAKYFANLAWNSIKESLPPGSRLNQQEFIAAMKTLNPNSAQDAGAVNTLLAKQKAISQWHLDTANRAQQYLRQGGDPRAFAQWNNKYYTMSKAVNAEPAAPATVRVKGPNGTGTIPAARLKDYLANGYTQVQ